MQDQEAGPARPADDAGADRTAQEEAPAEAAPRLLAYVARFDRGEFWLAHEEMEEHWQEHRQDLYKGLIQVAAGLLHAERRNWNGARRLLSTALEYLEPYPATAEGFDVTGIREAVARIRRRVAARAASHAAEGREEDDDSLRFPMSRYFAADVPADLVEDEELPYRVRRYDQGYRPYGREEDRGADAGSADGEAADPGEPT